MALRDLLRLRRRDRRGSAHDDQAGLSEDDVRRLQRVQRATASRVRVLRRGQ